jgi:hypothetical protein
MIKQIPDDYYQWIETLDAEFEDRLGRILRGPMWSGQSSDCIGDPLKVLCNVFAFVSTFQFYKQI